MSGTRAHFALGASGKIDVENDRRRDTFRSDEGCGAGVQTKHRSVLDDSHQKLKIARRCLM
jgi:hypothetical protein